MDDIVHIKRRWIGASARRSRPKGEIVTPQQHDDKICYAIEALERVKKGINKEHIFDLVITPCNRVTTNRFTRTVICSEVTCPLCLVKAAEFDSPKPMLYKTPYGPPFNQVVPGIKLETQEICQGLKQLPVHIYAPNEPERSLNRSGG